jgi:hypothetical protein
MPTPAPDPNEPSKMKKLTSGNMDDSSRSRPSSRNGSTISRTPVPPGVVSTASSSYPQSGEPRFKFLPAFWTIASLLSLVVNIVLIVILLILFQMLGAIQNTADDKVSGLLGGLYSNFVRMDQAHIKTTIDVVDNIPVNFDLNVSGPTVVRLTQPVRIEGASVTVSTGTMSIINAPATIILPVGQELPVEILGLGVPVRQTVPVTLKVPVDIPLERTDLHEPFLGLQQVVRPWYCLVEPNATFKDTPVCSQMTNPFFPTPTPAGTVIP